MSILNYRLILADDEPSIRNGLSLMPWHELGFELVGVFSDGSEVIEFLQNESADVVLTDIVMPQVTGIEVAKWVHENRPETHVVLLSGYADFNDAQKAIEYQVRHYLLKPTDRDELAEKFRSIHQALERNSASEDDQPEIPLQKKIDLYIEQHMKDGLSLTGAAEFVYMSPAYLSRVFKEETGENYNNYVTRKRVEIAKRLLLESDLQIQEICEEVGYQDVHYFIRQFRRSTGMSPSQFRKRNVRSTD